MRATTMKDTQIPHVPVVIVGGGQAGLSTAYSLKKKGIDSIVFERNAAFHSWKVNRWDSFCLVTPNWQCRLPDFHYDRDYGGNDPDGFMLRDEITDYLDAFLDRTAPNLHEGVEVTRVTPLIRGGFGVETSIGN